MGQMTNSRSTFWLVFLLLSQLFNHPVYAQKLHFATKPVNRVAIGAKYSYAFAAVDSLQQTITYSCVNLPRWIVFDKNKNTLSGIAKKPGQYAVTINAVTKDTMVKQSFMLTVFDAGTVNILPLGNSITNGTSTYNSYRRDLWQLLHKGKYNFDFIGSWDKHHAGRTVPNPDFDTDHEGHSGWTIHHVLEPPDWDKERGNLDDWLKLYRPDIVLIELGTNDVFQCVDATSAMNDLATVIEKLRTKNASVKILLAQIPPLGAQWSPKKLCSTDTSYESAIKIFNDAVLRFAQTKTTGKSPVLIVDQFTGTNPAVDMYDDIHPNEKGERKMSQRWFDALKPFLKKL